MYKTINYKQIKVDKIRCTAPVQSVAVSKN